MEVTKQMIKERFDEYNKLYFGGKLGKCKFYLLPKNTTMCGRFVGGKDSKGKDCGHIWIGNNVLRCNKHCSFSCFNLCANMYIIVKKNV